MIHWKMANLRSKQFSFVKMISKLKKKKKNNVEMMVVYFSDTLKFCAYDFEPCMLQASNHYYAKILKYPF